MGLRCRVLIPLQQLIEKLDDTIAQAGSSAYIVVFIL